MITVQDIKREFTTNLVNHIMIKDFYTREQLEIVAQKGAEMNTKFFSKKKNEVYLKELAKLFNKMERDGEVLIVDKETTSLSVLTQVEKLHKGDMNEVFLVGKENDYKVSGVKSFSGVAPATNAKEYLDLFIRKNVLFKSFMFDANSILYSEAVNHFVINIVQLNKDKTEDQIEFNASVDKLSNYIFKGVGGEDGGKEFFSQKDSSTARDMFYLTTEAFTEYYENRYLPMPLVLERLANEVLREYEDPEKTNGLDKMLYRLQTRPYRFSTYFKGFINRFSEKQKEYLLSKLIEGNVVNIINIELVKQMYDKKGAKIFNPKLVDKGDGICSLEMNNLKNLIPVLEFLNNKNTDVRRFENFGKSITIDGFDDLSITFKKSQYPNLTEENIIPFITETMRICINNNNNNKNILYQEDMFDQEFNRLYRENALQLKLNELPEKAETKKKKL